MLSAVVGGTLAMQLAAMALPPLRGILGLTSLAVTDWAVVAGAAALPFVLKELCRQGERNGIASESTGSPIAPTSCSI